jgi:hypothetical protein
MPLQAAEAIELPDLICRGYVEQVKDPYLSEKGVYHVLPINIKAIELGKDGTFFFLFRPEWFGSKFNPKSLLDGTEQGRRLYGNYRRFIADRQSKSVLTILAGDNFDAIAAEFEANENPTPEEIAAVLKQYLTGNEVGYVMTQRKDSDGYLTDNYNIDRFFSLTDEDIDRVIRAAEKRKKDTVVTWQD